MLKRLNMCAAILAITACRVVSADESWSLVSAEDAVSGESVTSIQQISADTIADESGKKDVHPLLEFRCNPDRDPSIRFRINWQRFVSSFNTEVGFRVDGSKALWLKLGVDKTNNITISKSVGDVDKLIRKLRGAEIVEIEIAPYSEPAVFASFNVATFDTALATLSQSCK